MFVVIVHDPDAKEEFRAFAYRTFKRADADATAWRDILRRYSYRASVFVLPVEQPGAFKT